MADVIRAEIVGIRMAENGSLGYTVNSTEYSVLVFFDNGICELVEGSAADIRPFLPYLSPRVDYNQMVSMLAQFEEKLKQDIKSIVRQALLENNNPIPIGLIGKSDIDAIRILEAAGFKTETEYTAPAGIHGIVMQYTRKENDPMTVVLKIIYDVPDVKGMKQEDAIRSLRSAGFSTVIKHQICEGEPGTVIDVLPEDGTLNVILVICDNSKLNENIFVDKMQKCSSVSDIWSIWSKTDMASKYKFKNVTEMIKREKSSEEKFGKKTGTQIESIKLAIKTMLLD